MEQLNKPPNSVDKLEEMAVQLVCITGRGAGVDERGAHKAAVIDRAIEVNQPNKEDSIDVLAKVDGLETGGMVSAMIGAAKNRVPIVVDG